MKKKTRLIKKKHYSLIAFRYVFNYQQSPLIKIFL